MTALDVWLKDLLPRTPGLLPEVATRETILAAREFATRSYIWREVSATMAATAGQATYAPVPADAVNTEVFGVTAVEYQGVRLRPIDQRPIGADTSGEPMYWYSTLPGQCTLWPTPATTVANALRFHLALLPKDTATVLPDFIYRQYYDAILDGALSRIFGHPNKPYTDPNRMMDHRKRFRVAIAQASAAVKTGNNDTQLWRYPPFA